MKGTTPRGRTAALKAGRRAELRGPPNGAASKITLQQWCRDNNWKLVFFEGASGAPCTGVVDAVMVRLLDF